MADAKHKTGPFDYLNSINFSKKNIMVDEIDEKTYLPFMINRGLSYFQDTILFANEMNINHNIDNKLQYSFFINIIRKRKRFSKWFKPEIENDIEVIKTYYGYSTDKARQVLHLLSKEQIKIMKEKVSHGGIRKK